MTRSELLLTVLAEECNETAQRVSKALRFGLNEVQRGQDLTNAQRIVYEFNDIMAVMDILRQEGFIENVIDADAIQKKKDKLAEYMDYSQKCGVITK
jgi:ribosomal protein S8